MITLIPVFDVRAAINHWPIIQPGVVKLLEYNIGDMTEASIYNDIAGGNYLLWIVQKDKAYAGFMLTKLERQHNGTICCVVIGLYVESGEPGGLFQIENDPLFQEYIKKAQCSSMAFYTLRDKAFERVHRDNGWVPTYTKFIKGVVNNG